MHLNHGATALGQHGQRFDFWRWLQAEWRTFRSKLVMDEPEFWGVPLGEFLRRKALKN